MVDLDYNIFIKIGSRGTYPIKQPRHLLWQLIVYIIENKVYVTTKNGRLFIINFSNGAIDKILKLDREKLQRPVYFDKELYIAKDNSIIRIN